MTIKINNLSVFLFASIANLLGFIAGLAYSWSSPVVPKLKETNSINNPLDHAITPFEESWIVGLLSMGAIFGPVFSGFTADSIGRKKTLLLVSLPLLVSLIMMAFAKTVVTFYIARTIMGLCVGGIFMILPMYLIEIAEDHNRGTFGCLMSVFITLGLLFSYTVGPYITVQNFCMMSTIPLLIFIPVFITWNPESPLYLSVTNNQKGLKESLKKLRNKSIGEIEKEMYTINTMVQELNYNKGRFGELLSSYSVRKALSISIGLILFQQFSGINAVLSYTQTIFAETGIGLSPEICSVIVGTIQVGATIVTSRLVDKFGRKILLLISSCGSSLSLLALGLHFFLLDNNFQTDSFSWLSVTSLIGFIIFFNLGLGSLPFTIMAEIFPPNVKSLALTLTTVMCFIGASIITLCFPSFVLFLGMAVTFWFFAGVCTAGFIFTYWVVPETKGRSLREIQSLLEDNSL